MKGGPLVCPRCATTHPLSERFCPACRMPLTYGGPPPPVSETHERARKIRPQYSDGPLEKVAWARNQAEAELIAGMLLEEGVPSMIKRARGFDVPDFLAAGPRDVLVPASGAAAAADILMSAGETAEPGAQTRPWRVAVALLVGVGVAAAITALLANA